MRLAFTAAGVFSSYLVWGWRYPSRWKAVDFRRRIEPDLRELQVGRANLFCLRLARPFETFVGHRTILGGRFHEPLHAVTATASRQFGRRRRQDAQNQLCCDSRPQPAYAAPFDCSARRSVEFAHAGVLGRAWSDVDIRSLEAVSSRREQNSPFWGEIVTNTIPFRLVLTNVQFYRPR